MIRILYIHNSADRYGASRCLLRLMKGLPRERYHPMLVLPERGPLQDAIEMEGVEVIVEEGLSVISRSHYGSRGLFSFLLGVPLSAWRLRRMITDRGIDLVHTNTGTVVSAGLAARLAGVKHVWHIREWYQEFRRLWSLYERYILTCSDKVTAVSRPMADQFRPNPKVVVINDGFDLGEFAVDRERLRREFRQEHGIGEDEFVAGCVGRIKLVRKGQEVLVRALGRLSEEGVRMKLLLAGAPFPGNEEHLEQLKDLIREAGIEADTVYLGEVSDAKPAYSAMDVLVLPSCQPEPFGGVVIEAMAMELPVIATAIGGSLEQVDDGVTGFLVEPNNDKKLADKLRELYRDREKARRFGAAGKGRVERLFQFEDMRAKFEQMYEELVGTGTENDSTSF